MDRTSRAFGARWSPVMAAWGPSALSSIRARADDAAVPADALASIGWAGLLVILVIVAVVIGRTAARFFLRATGARAGRNKAGGL